MQQEIEQLKHIICELVEERKKLIDNDSEKESEIKKLISIDTELQEKNKLLSECISTKEAEIERLNYLISVLATNKQIMNGLGESA